MDNFLIDYTLHLADTSLILAQRNAEWCGLGPVLEQDIAITNISLDLLGQARNYYQYAATIIGGTATEDSLAYHRTEREFKNLLLAEQPNGDWAQTILRQYLFSQFQYLQLQQLQQSHNQQLAAIAAKAIKEVSYHLRWSSEWVIRLGDGTTESNQRMQNAISVLWPFTGEFFIPANYEKEFITVETLQTPWLQNVDAIFTEATLPIPATTFMQQGGKQGLHTEAMGYILAELQYLQRTYPGAEW
ncbi:MAG: phenylacetate-CoA oxygenase subunit PaaI [Sphingobacteriales bacterium]|nr:MAG: phenylacetate-CoA oxygenase subunit PaaI [Sphingobacteriales bacterium]